MAAMYQDEFNKWIPVPHPILIELLIRNAILNALAYTDGDQTKAAKLLGITDRVINFKMSKLGIPRARRSFKSDHSK